VAARRAATVAKPARRTPRSNEPEPSPRPFGVAGLFAGIGGIELGLHAAGHTTRLLCELDPGARAVLEARFPGVALHSDVRSLRSLPSDVQLLCAGFPCQDLSQAGRTAGILGSRSGLVHEALRLLRSERTPWVLLENVPFMLQLGKGAALDVILSELEGLGYRWAYRVVNSRAFGLPQRRCRVFLVAALEADPCTVLFADEAGPPPLRGEDAPRKARAPRPRSAHACGFYWTEGIRGLGWAEDGVPTLKGGSTIGIPSPPAIVLPDGRIVKPDIRDAERLQGFAADWTAPALGAAKRGHRWKLVGNAVTVDVAEWLGLRLLQPGPLAVELGADLVRGTPWPKAACNLGQGRRAVHASEWPVRRPSTPLDRFLEFAPEPLSVKATAGFLKRTQASSLHFPEGFLEAVESHLAYMQSGAPNG
jgi:DNA (cytosine-5)-methyltransferase 1